MIGQNFMQKFGISEHVLRCSKFPYGQAGARSGKSASCFYHAHMAASLAQLRWRNPSLCPPSKPHVGGSSKRGISGPGRRCACLRGALLANLVEVISDVRPVLVKGVLERRASVPATGLNVRASLNKQLGYVQVVVLARRKQRGEPVHHPSHVHVCALVDEPSHRF